MSFEVGKTYRTQRGRKMKIDGTWSGGVVGKEVDGNPCNLHTMLYHEDGKPSGSGWELFELLPGAMEDEKPWGTPRTPHSDIWSAITTLQASSAGMAAKIEEHTKMLTEHDQALLKAQCNGHEYLSDRLDEQGKQIGTLQTAQIKTFARLDYHGIRLPPAEPLQMKPIIKGGWVNIFRQWPASVCSIVYSDEREARQARLEYKTLDYIACIHIPDFTEGEGLTPMRSD